MSFDRILNEVLEGVEGSLFAAIFDGDGELVQIVCREGLERHRMRLIGAYESIFHRGIGDALALSDCRSVSCHFACYTGGVVVTYPLIDGYFLSLYGDPECNIGQGILRLKASREKVEQEM